ncbi:unnamed protein product [Meloidogyne enterolobii]|uniref:Uncharacterized protein n=1 Tax=Meloidogyne enterolobii TaxID=390850 RepID=A0ACB0ZIJ5_MELEN
MNNAANILLQQHQQYRQHLPQNFNRPQTQRKPPEDILIVDQLHMTTTNITDVCSATSEVHHLSPQSEFLTHYSASSQHTPGSQHSSQVLAYIIKTSYLLVIISPPAIPNSSSRNGQIMINNNNNNNYLLQQQQHSFSSSMDNLCIIENQNSASSSNRYIQEQQQQQQNNRGGGHKRRRISTNQSSNDSMLLSKSNNLPNIKCEYGTVNNQQQEHQQRQNILHHQQQQQQSFEDLEDNNFGGTQRTIKFEPFLRESWATLFDINQQPLPIMPIVVVADKGFNFSPSDNCFVNQKKNHFQITVNIGVNPMANANSPQMGNGQQTIQHQFAPHYVRTELHGRVFLLPIVDKKFYLSFCGVKSDMQTYEIPIKQSQTDRKPIDHMPVCFAIDGTQDSVKQTVPRLHFSETTMNNHRKNGKPNPEQKFFLLVMKLSVETAIGDETRKVLVQSFHSDRVIVRASNPGQFEQPESDQSWKNQNGALTFSGPVCIGSDKPIGDAQLTVHGNIAASGQITRPSDKRLKEDIEEISTAEAMGRVAQMRLVEFAYKPEIAARWGLSERDRHRVGVIAQELAEVLPEAVKDNGDFLTVDDTRIFYDTVAAAQELYRLTGNLECKIGQVERISHKLAQYARKRRQLGSMASGLSDFSSLFPGQNFSSKNLQNTFEDKSLSQSRTSLTSAATAPAIAYNDENEDEIKDKSSKNRSRNSSRNAGKRDKKSSLPPPPSPPRKHRCRSHSSASAYCGRQQVYCRGQEAALCNSKFTQGTIVTLVVIMALCLVTMCTLYVVDWYNRTYLSPHFHHYHPYMGEGTEKQQKHQKPTDSQPIPSDIDRPPPPGKMRGLLDSDWIPPLQSNILPISLQYCSTNFDKNNPFISGPITKPNCQNNCCPISKNSENSENKLIDKQIQALLQNNKNTLSNLNFENGVKIEILNLGIILDKNYCLLQQNCQNNSNNLCNTLNSCNSRIGRYNLYIPISSDLTTAPLRLKINSADPSLFVESCGSLSGFRFKECNNYLNKNDFNQNEQLIEEEEELINEGGKNIKSKPRSQKIGINNIFEISAGSFLQSAYKFRIGHSTGLCKMEEKQKGRSFDEFNLIFYRECIVTTTTTSTTLF